MPKFWIFEKTLKFLLEFPAKKFYYPNGYVTNIASQCINISCCLFLNRFIINVYMYKRMVQFKLQVETKVVA